MHVLRHCTYFKDRMNTNTYTAQNGGELPIQAKRFTYGDGKLLRPTEL